MAWIWSGMVVLSLLYAAFSGALPSLTTAAMDGAQSAVTLCISLTGGICLWSGVMEVLRQSGGDRFLAGLLRPVLTLLFPQSIKDKETASALCGNISANLLGLGNAATPLGVRAATRMAQRSGGIASDELCRLVVLNTASIQLLPTTVAILRSSEGACAPFDILPCVWISSAISVAVGLSCAFLFARMEGKKK